MKKFLISACCIFLVYSCTDNKSVQKKLLNNIMATHERVMNAENSLMDNKMLIDSLLKSYDFDPKDSAVKKTEMRVQSTKLAKADEAMDDWMHNFDPHKKGRTDDEQLRYLRQQGKQIQHVDTLINQAIISSTKVLKQNTFK